MTHEICLHAGCMFCVQVLWASCHRKHPSRLDWETDLRISHTHTKTQILSVDHTERDHVPFQHDRKWELSNLPKYINLESLRANKYHLKCLSNFLTLFISLIGSAFGCVCHTPFIFHKNRSDYCVCVACQQTDLQDCWSVPLAGS